MFPDLPDDIYKYQNTFNYEQWTPNTKIHCCNVTWDASYRDLVRFDSDEEKAAYFAAASSYEFDLGGYVYLRYGEPIRVNVPFDVMAHCNYLVVTNKMQPITSVTASPRTPDTFYYFIQDVTYIAPNTTQLNVQLDVWQTYYDRLSFGRCYIERGHIGIANENSTLENLSEYLLDLEGLEIGAEYDVVTQRFKSFQDSAPWVVVMTSATFQASPGTITQPNLNISVAQTVAGMPSAQEVYAMRPDAFYELMGKLQYYSWVAQCISMITIVPDGLLGVNTDAPLNWLGMSKPMYRLNYDNQYVYYKITDLLSNYEIPDRYKHLYKFYTHPYCSLEITLNNGSVLVCRNEDFSDPDSCQFAIRTHISPPFMRSYIYPMAYNTVYDDALSNHYYMPSGQDYNGWIHSGDAMDYALLFDEFPQIATIVNNSVNYLASTANTRAWQIENAQWSQNKALSAASLAYAQSSNATDTFAQQQQLGRDLSYTNMGLRQDLIRDQTLGSIASQAVGGVLGGAASGSVSGAIQSSANIAATAYNAALQQNYLTETTAAAAQNNLLTTQNSINQQRFNRDTNFQYAQMASMGDYEQAIQAIQAKVQDAQLIKPSISAQYGGSGYNWLAGYCGILFKWKRLKPNYITQIGEFWLRYGYYINRWITPPNDLKCMNKFTYWKMTFCAVFGDMPEIFKQAIRGIFERGTTIWVEPSDVNIIDTATNEPIEGVAY